jgi:CRP-like cAMP-binding protein
VEKPFRVGNWVSLAGFEGAVAEVTWRATKIRTKLGNLVIIPNNTVAREAISNFSEPELPTRVTVDVGAAYGTPPNQVRTAILAAIRQAPQALPHPPADVLLHDFGGSALIYRSRFWIADASLIDEAQDEVRRTIYYEFGRRRIEIPYPIQIEYSREEVPLDLAALRERLVTTISKTPVLSGLPAEAHRALAEDASEHAYGDGEVIVRDGEPGGSMFVVSRGEVSIFSGGREVAVTPAGGYFGEMSLLTGDPRSATVCAKGDCVVVEISASAFGAWIRSHPEAIERLADAAAARRRELDASRATAAAPLDAGTLVDRIRKFFGLRR